MIRLPFATVATTAAALALAACADGREEELHILAIGDDTEAMLLAGALAQGLVRFDSDGQIEQGLASSWHVSDDGLSYIFRLGDARWSDGGEVDARSVARALERAIASPELAVELGGVRDIRAMTDKVIEIRLSSPQPQLLQLLAQPALAIRDEERGTGPFGRLPDDGEDGAGILIGRVVETARGDFIEEKVRIETADARAAVERFGAGEVALVTGGTFATLPIAKDAQGVFERPRYDPVAGLFGLQVTSDKGWLGDRAVRGALSAAIDRDSLVAAMGVPGLLPRATILQSGLDMAWPLTPPPFVDLPMEERRATARAIIEAAFADAQEDEERPATDLRTVTVALPDGPGATRLAQQLAADWGAIGLSVRVVGQDEPADLRLIDEVALSSGPGWFLDRFDCARVDPCAAEAQPLLETARSARSGRDRQRLLARAAAAIEDAHIFMPLSAPVRWSLVSPTLTGFRENRFARHFVGGLRVPAQRSAS